MGLLRRLFSPARPVFVSEDAAQLRRHRDNLAGINASLGARIRDLTHAIDAAGFRAAPDMFGDMTLWCTRCNRDSGYHFENCTKFRHGASPANDVPESEDGT